jgi:hypothetical protein
MIIDLNHDYTLSERKQLIEHALLEAQGDMIRISRKINKLVLLYNSSDNELMENICCLMRKLQ